MCAWGPENENINQPKRARKNALAILGVVNARFAGHAQRSAGPDTRAAGAVF
jgi:hypothetical protein